MPITPLPPTFPHVGSVTIDTQPDPIVAARETKITATNGDVFEGPRTGVSNPTRDRNTRKRASSVATTNTPAPASATTSTNPTRDRSVAKPAPKLTEEQRAEAKRRAEALTSANGMHGRTGEGYYAPSDNGANQAP